MLLNCLYIVLKKIGKDDRIKQNKEKGMILMTTLLKNGKLIDYKTNTNDIYDILIEDDKIKEISKNITTKADKTIDCTNLNIIPGMIDIHCHLREPGFEYKETIETVAKSAVKGGLDRKSTRLNSSHESESRMPSSA